YYLMFFTFNAEQFASHYDDDEKYYLCLGEGCCPGLAHQGAIQLFANPCFDQGPWPTILPDATLSQARFTEEIHGPVFLHQVPFPHVVRPPAAARPRTSPAGHYCHRDLRRHRWRQQLACHRLVRPNPPFLVRTVLGPAQWHPLIPHLRAAVPATQ